MKKITLILCLLVIWLGAFSQDKIPAKQLDMNLNDAALNGDTILGKLGIGSGAAPSETLTVTGTGSFSGYLEIAGGYSGGGITLDGLGFGLFQRVLTDGLEMSSISDAIPYIQGSGDFTSLVIGSNLSLSSGILNADNTNLSGSLSSNLLTITSSTGNSAVVDMSPIINEGTVQLGSAITTSSSVVPIDTVWGLVTGTATLLDVKIVLIQTNTLDVKAIEGKFLIKGNATPSVVSSKDIISETEFGDLTGNFDFSLTGISSSGIKITVTSTTSNTIYWKSETTITTVTGVLP